ncbi:hypothetical protein JX265_007962 [Neoarthrinium moseri]|uniref:Uncharacterized protein n=1 Tax=Neoarthrinium moseri TaxID=1658444 RepID=A0A9P9WIX8_9PEZI|nr:hypothetical protein JX265_007962 [Neoarthrinium moseri]
MGAQASQLERTDRDTVGDGSDTHSRANSPFGQTFPGSDQGSPEPFENHQPQSQDIAFSSQVPRSPGRTRHLYRTNGRASVPKFERPSASPDPELAASKVEVETEVNPGQATGDTAAKPTKQKRRRSKKKDGQATDSRKEAGKEQPQDQGASMTSPADLVGGVRASGPRSSIDLDASSSSPALVNGVSGSLRDGEQGPTEAEALRRQRKLERKERKRAKKLAGKLKNTLLETDPNFGGHENTDALVQARSVQNLNDLGTAQPEADTRLHEEEEDNRMDDPNQLPTPDDEAQPRLPTNNFTFLQLDGDDVAEQAHAAVQPSPLKRKGKDTDKKSRKKRKQHPDEADGIHPDVEGGSNQNTVAPLVPASTRSGSRQMSPGSQARAPTDIISDLARDFYTQHYSATKNSTTRRSASPAASRHKRLKLGEYSPSAARLQRSLERSDPSGPPEYTPEVKRETAMDDGHEEDPMDVDEEHQESNGSEREGSDAENQNGDYEEAGSAGSVDDIEMPEVDSLAGDEPEKQPDLGSDDLGVGSTAVQGEALAETHTGQDSPHSPAVGDGPGIAPATSSKSKSLKQYGPKPSTGKRRLAKKSFLDREEDANVNAFAELPSPTAAAVSRKGKERAMDSAAEPGLSNTNGNSKQLKLSSMLNSDAPSSSAAGTSKQITTSYNGLFATKKSRKVKDPKPDEEVSGVFSEFELRNLKVAIQRWRQIHKIDEDDMKDMIQKNPQIAKTGEFWDHVHAALPKRKRQKVINQARKIYHNFVARGSWTQEQHEELVRAFEIHGRNFKVIANLINRHSEDVRDRIRNYVICGDKRKTDVWSHEEEGRLIQIIQEALDQIRQLKASEGAAGSDLLRRDEEELIDWSLVSENMDHTRSRLQCLTKWKTLRLRIQGGNIDGQVARSMDEIVQQARADFDTMTHKDRYLIAKAVSKSGAKADSRIPWHKLRRTYGAVERWNRPALLVAWHRMRRSLPNWRTMLVLETSKALMAKYRESGEQLHVLPPEEMDLDAEYREVEHKVEKILKGIGGPKTPHFATKSDEGDEDEASVDLGLDDDEDEDEGDIGDVDDLEIDESVHGSPQAVRSKSNLRIGANLNKPKSARNPRKRQNAHSPQPADEQSPAQAAMKSSSEPNEMEQLEDSKPEANKSRRKSRGKGKAKARAAKRALSDEKIVDEVSSDTGAEDVEDIPAVLPS